MTTNNVVSFLSTPRALKLQHEKKGLSYISELCMIRCLNKKKKISSVTALRAVR